MDKKEPVESPGRRQFLGRVLSASAGFLMASSTTEQGVEGAPQAASCPTSAPCASATGQELLPPGELTSTGGFLRGVVTVEQDLRNVTYYTGNKTFNCRSHLLR